MGRQLRDINRSCFTTRTIMLKTHPTPTIRGLVLICVLSVGLAGGCAKKKPPSKPSPQPASIDQVQQIRNAYFRAYPDSRVGVVTETLRHANGYFVRVGEIDGNDFREGGTVTFIDGRQHLLTTGTVVKVLRGAVDVLVDRPKAGGRLPGTGDLMVKLPFGATTL
jgi:hypothetical protein